MHGMPPVDDSEVMVAVKPGPLSHQQQQQDQEEQQEQDQEQAAAPQPQWRAAPQPSRATLLGSALDTSSMFQLSPEGSDTSLGGKAGQLRAQPYRLHQQQEEEEPSEGGAGQA